MKIDMNFTIRKIKLFFYIMFVYVFLLFFINYISSFYIGSDEKESNFNVLVPGIYEIVVGVDSEEEVNCFNKSFDAVYIKNNIGDSIDLVKVNRVAIVTGGSKYFIFSKGFLGLGSYSLNFSDKNTICKNNKFNFSINLKSSSSAIFSIIQFCLYIFSPFFVIYFSCIIFLAAKALFVKLFNGLGGGCE